MNKIALITGTSTGLGLSMTLMLAKQGFHVYATMRNLSKKTELEAAITSDMKVSIKQLDVQDSASVNQCVADIIALEGKIDVLINNAGAGFVRNTEQATEEDIQWVMDVNYMGVVRCTKAVLPFMREARAGHIINISSVGGLVGQPFNEIYCAAKFAVEGYTESMASYIQPSFNVKFTLVEPGGIKSEFANNVMEQVTQSGGMLEDEYLPILQKYIGGVQGRNDTGIYQTCDEVSAVVLNCIQSENPPIRTRTSDWSNEFCQLKTQADPDGKRQQQTVIDTFL
jgi:NAD(P)-dependent dehydrogenase (short-subunit alcohol dehydrogenase family)